MSRTWDTLKDLDRFIRTALIALAVGGIGWGGWVFYSTYHAAEIKEGQLVSIRAQLAEREMALAAEQQRVVERDGRIAAQQEQLAAKDRQIDVLEVDVAAKAQEIERLDTAMRLLKVDRRLAQVIVRDVEVDPDSGETVSRIEFVEVDADGRAVDQPRELRLRGDEVRIDCWLVKFEDRYVEQADLDRSTSLCLFKRIYGNVEGPMQGHPLDAVGARPRVYGRGELSDFEKRIWDDFWSIASDPQQAEELGIRAAHGQSVYFKAIRGKMYRVMLRASDGLTVTPAEDAPAEPPKPAA